MDLLVNVDLREKLVHLVMMENKDPLVPLDLLANVEVLDLRENAESLDNLEHPDPMDSLEMMAVMVCSFLLHLPAVLGVYCQLVSKWLYYIVNKRR